jgi:hypothetical protein
MNFEEAVVAAITAEFFKPQPGSIDQYGVVTYNPAPAMNVANALYDAKKKEITDAVTATVDIDDLAGKIAKVLVGELNRSGWASYQGDQFRKEVRDKVIDKVAQAQAEELLTSRTYVMNKEEADG